MKIKNGMIEAKLVAYNQFRFVRMRGQAAIDIAGNARALAKASSLVEDARNLLFGNIPDLQEYERQRLDICNELASRDANNKPIMSGGNYVFATKESADLVNARIAALNAVYPETSRDRDVAIKKFMSLLDTEVEIELKAISIADITGDVTPEMVVWLESEFKKVKPDEEEPS